MFGKFFLKNVDIFLPLLCLKTEVFFRREIKFHVLREILGKEGHCDTNIVGGGLFAVVVSLFGDASVVVYFCHHLFIYSNILYSY